MPDEKRRGPFCSVPKCVEVAEGAVLFAYVKESKRFLCEAHMRPIRAALLELIHEPLPAPVAAE